MDNAYTGSGINIQDRDLTREAEIQPALNLLKDRIHWPAVIAGLVTALTAQMFFSLLGIATGLTNLNLGGDWMEVSAQNFSTYMMVWSAVSALVAFFLGGFLASRSAAVFSRGWGALNGAMVFLVSVPLMLWLASAGIGSLFGALGNFAAMLNVDPASMQQTFTQITSSGQIIPGGASPEQLQQSAEVARNAALGVLGAMLLGLIASTVGGLTGVRRAVEINTATGEVSDS